MVRAVALAAGLMTALPALAGEMTASEARQFVVGKLFSYTCFDGTRGVARVHADGSVDGSIQPAGAALARYGTMPVGTLEGCCDSSAGSARREAQRGSARFGSRRFTVRSRSMTVPRLLCHAVGRLAA